MKPIIEKKINEAVEDQIHHFKTEGHKDFMYNDINNISILKINFGEMIMDTVFKFHSPSEFGMKYNEVRTLVMEKLNKTSTTLWQNFLDRKTDYLSKYYVFPPSLDMSVASELDAINKPLDDINGTLGESCN